MPRRSQSPNQESLWNNTIVVKHSKKAYLKFIAIALYMSFHKLCLDASRKWYEIIFIDCTAESFSFILDLSCYSCLYGNIRI